MACALLDIATEFPEFFQDDLPLLRITPVLGKNRFRVDPVDRANFGPRPFRHADFDSGTYRRIGREAGVSRNPFSKTRMRRPTSASMPASSQVSRCAVHCAASPGCPIPAGNPSFPLRRSRTINIRPSSRIRQPALPCGVSACCGETRHMGGGGVGCSAAKRSTPLTAPASNSPR